MEDKIIKTSEISIKIGLNENKLPLQMKWSANDGNVDNADTKAMFLSLWDPKEKNTMKIDLWTKDLTVDEMKQFFHQTLVSMAASFERATDDQKMTATMRDFCDYFAEKLELKKS